MQRTFENSWSVKNSIFSIIGAQLIDWGLALLPNTKYKTKLLQAWQEWLYNDIQDYLQKSQ